MNCAPNWQQSKYIKASSFPLKKKIGYKASVSSFIYRIKRRANKSTQKTFKIVGNKLKWIDILGDGLCAVQRDDSRLCSFTFSLNICAARFSSYVTIGRDLPSVFVFGPKNYSKCRWSCRRPTYHTDDIDNRKMVHLESRIFDSVRKI